MGLRHWRSPWHSWTHVNTTHSLRASSTALNLLYSILVKSPGKPFNLFMWLIIIIDLHMLNHPCFCRWKHFDYTWVFFLIIEFGFLVVCCYCCFWGKVSLCCHGSLAWKVYRYFIDDYFCSNFHQEDWPSVAVISFSGFGTRLTKISSLQWFWSISSIYSSRKNARNMVLASFFFFLRFGGI